MSDSDSQEPKGKIYIVKDSNLWKDIPDNDRLTHVAFTYGIINEDTEPYKNGIRAVIKFLHAGEQEAVEKVAEKLAGNNQNRHIMINKIGGWMPLSNNYEQYSKDVKIQQKQGNEALRAYTSEEDKKARQEMKEIDDRREALKEEEVTTEDTATLEYYTMQRRKEEEIELFIKEGEKKLKDAKNKLRDVKLRNADLKEANPHFEDLWREELKKKIASEGVGGERGPIINERVE